MPRILFFKFTGPEAKEFYTTKAHASDKALRVDSTIQASHITLAAVALKYISGKYDSYSSHLIILEIIGLFIAMNLVMLWILRFERSLARKRLEEKA